MTWIDEIGFDERGLVPVVTQDAMSGDILMLAYANREALERTQETRRAHYWSRSRSELWRKGDTSGHIQELVELRVDCDGDTVLYRVHQTGPACHLGNRSCFSRIVQGYDLREDESPGHILERVADVVAKRELDRPEGSYTTYLFDQGVDKILKKVGEESTEVVVAAKNDDPAELTAETADLLFHLLVLLRARNLPVDEVWKELQERFGRAPRERNAHHSNHPDS